MHTPALTRDSGPTRTAAALQAYREQRAAIRFDWAAANCCHFGGGWMRYAAGVDPMAGLPTTPSARAALRLVRALGGDLAAAWTRQLQQEPIPAAQARVGDLVLQWMPGEGAGGRVGVCNGERVLLAEGRTVQLRECALAWRLWGAS